MSKVNSILLVIGLVLLAQATVIPRTSPIDSHKPCTYTMKISDPPKVRWAPIVRDYRDEIQRFLDFAALIPLPKGFLDGVEYFAKHEFKHQDFVAEIEALAELGEFKFDEVFLLNFVYDFSTIKACTGIVLRNSEGKILHGRNMDFEMWELISKLVVNVEYVDDSGKRVFAVDYVAGSVFALTGERFGAYSLNEDTRKQSDAVYADLVSLLKNQAIPSTWLMRKVLEEESTYKSATQRLMNTEISAPIYYILAGLEGNEGMVIERNNKGVHAVYELTDERWFLVQTNYDRDIPDPVHDPRRVPAEKKLKEMGNVGLDENVLLHKLMSVWPTFNIASILTSVMHPASSYHNTTVWYGFNPKQCGESPQLSTE